jgi:hypothetical protein
MEGLEIEAIEDFSAWATDLKIVNKGDFIGLND